MTDWLDKLDELENCLGIIPNEFREELLSAYNKIVRDYQVDIRASNPHIQGTGGHDGKADHHSRILPALP